MDSFEERDIPSTSDAAEGSSESSKGMLVIEIADAMSEKDRVNFTIHTKTTLPNFKAQDMSVTRSHEDFVWLHEHFEDSPEFAGLIIPPCPPRPDFEASREKLLKLTEGEGSLTEDEVNKMKANLEAEYLATFKKTVAMHDVFLKRVSHHPALRTSFNLRIFLEFELELGVRVKSRTEKIGNFLQRSMSDSLSLVVASAATHSTNMDDIDEDAELKRNRETLSLNYAALRNAVSTADKMTLARMDMTEPLLLIHTNLHVIGAAEAPLTKFFTTLDEMFEKMQKIEARIASDQDLKLSDTMRYYRDDSQAALALLQRRVRALQDYAVATKNLEKARAKNKLVANAETAQSDAYTKFTKLSDSAREELREFNVRRVAYFKKHLVELTEFEIRNNVQELDLMKSTLASLKHIAEA